MVMPTEILQFVGAAVGGAVAGAVAAIAYMRNNRGNPRHGICRFSQTAVGQELEPLRTSLEHMKNDLSVVKDRLSRE